MKNNLTIYDNKGKSIDSITIVFNDTKERDIFGSRFYSYDCICASYNGVAFYQHSYCQKGKHLGNKVEFKNLDKDLQRKIKQELNN